MFGSVQDKGGSTVLTLPKASIDMVQWLTLATASYRWKEISNQPRPDTYVCSIKIDKKLAGVEEAQLDVR